VKFLPFKSTVFSLALLVFVHRLLAQTPTEQDPIPTSPLLQVHKLAAEEGRAVEQLRYARDLNDGILGPRNFTEAFKWFQSASQHGSTEASAWLGSMYLRGTGVEPDPVKAHDLVLAASSKGDKIGYRFLGMMCEEGVVEKQDYVRALTLYLKASELGDGYSFDRRGRLRLSGLGLGRSPKLAFSFYSQGAALGDQWAELHLGQMYRKGIGLPVSSSGTKPKPDIEQAIRWLQASAKQNNRVALYVLGKMAEAGEGGPADDKKAFLYFELSAAHSYPPALVAVGRGHEEGKGAQVNLLHAYIGYSLAAEQGDAEGASALRSLSFRLSASEIQQARSMEEDLKKRSGLEPELTSTAN
jgi:TPR repeat protein